MQARSVVEVARWFRASEELFERRSAPDVDVRRRENSLNSASKRLFRYLSFACPSARAVKIYELVCM